MSMRTPLGRVRGLGSAKTGTEHWWMQRVTAVALVPLGLWFVYAMIGLTGADHATAAAWLGALPNAVLMVLLIAALFHHMQLGLQVVIEDYIHGEAAKVACLMAVKGGTLLLAVAAVFAVLKVSLGS